MCYKVLGVEKMFSNLKTQPNKATFRYEINHPSDYFINVTYRDKFWNVSVREEKLKPEGGRGFKMFMFKSFKNEAEAFNHVENLLAGEWKQVLEIDR